MSSSENINQHDRTSDDVFHRLETLSGGKPSFSTDKGYHGNDLTAAAYLAVLEEH